jgi:SAM-dependent methyltransferase
MPTIPAERPEPAWSQAHQHREMAESFGVDAARYDRTRPAYPQELIARILAASPGRDVLDVGCGTGIVARQLRAAAARVLGIEPDARMAQFARGTGVAVDVSTLEAWDPAGRTFDAVVAGTAWHWIDPVAGAVKAAQALRPGGLLAPFWHVFQPPPPVSDALAAAYQRVVPDSPISLRPARTNLDRYLPMFAKVADGIRDAGGFDEPQQWRYDWERWYTRDEWLDQLPTSGALTRMPADQLADVLAAAGEAIDAMGGGFTLSYATVAVSAVRYRS